MKTELRLRPHTQLPGARVIEVWYDGIFVAEVTGAEGPGVRVLSKYDKVPVVHNGLVLEVRIAL